MKYISENFNQVNVCIRSTSVCLAKLSSNQLPLGLDWFKPARKTEGRRSSVFSVVIVILGYIITFTHWTLSKHILTLIGVEWNQHAKIFQKTLHSGLCTLQLFYSATPELFKWWQIYHFDLTNSSYKISLKKNNEIQMKTILILGV